MNEGQWNLAVDSLRALKFEAFGVVQPLGSPSMSRVGSRQRSKQKAPRVRSHQR